MKGFWPDPDVVMIHAGGNYLGKMKMEDLIAHALLCKAMIVVFGNGPAEVRVS